MLYGHYHIKFLITNGYLQSNFAVRNSLSLASGLSDLRNTRNKGMQRNVYTDKGNKLEKQFASNCT